MRKRKPKAPPWTYAFKCAKCDNIREIHDPAPELGTAIALIHSELSEALEEEREGNAVMYFHDCVTGEAKTDVAELRDDHSGRFKPEGLASELADVVIRTADLCGHLGIDLETVIRLKMDFNETRPYKHGKKF